MKASMVKAYPYSSYTGTMNKACEQGYRLFDVLPPAKYDRQYHFLSCTIPSLESSFMTQAQKIIIDTDPGIDDAMAIFFALRSPELDVIGLTTIFGNVHTDLATTNALRLLEIAGRADIPVAKGVDDPLAFPFHGPVPFVHGDDGQGNVHLPPPNGKAIDQNAAGFIIEQVMRAPGEITLVPIGPLTNIALALRLEPRIAQNVRQVVIMGGNATVPGNASPAAEANILNDPEAADEVFGADWRVTMVGLDVTQQVRMSRAHLADYGAIDNDMARHIARIVPFYASFYQRANGWDGIYVHDSSVIAYLIDPTLFTTIQCPVRVDCSSGISRGKTLAALVYPATRADTAYDRGDAISEVNELIPMPWRTRPNVNICVGVDGERLIALETARMRG